MGCRRLSSLLAIAALVLLAVPLAAIGQPDALVDRLAGQDRVHTAIQIARDTYDQADTAVLATARNYPDALAGSVLAHTLAAPLLLVEPDTIPQPVLDTLNELGVNQIVLLGGETAISPPVEAQLADRFGDGQVDRIAGATRYHTAVRVAQQAVAALSTVVLATGTNFPDAVSASALAASRGWPVLLTDPGQVPDILAWYLDGLADPPTVLPIGGPVAIADAVLDECAPAGTRSPRGLPAPPATPPPTPWPTASSVTTRPRCGSPLGPTTRMRSPPALLPPPPAGCCT